MTVTVRFAQNHDYNDVLNLVRQIHRIHVLARPDIYSPDPNPMGKDYFLKLLQEERSQVIVVEDQEQEKVVAYSVIRIDEPPKRLIHTSRKYIFIEDFCVDEQVPEGYINHNIEIACELAKKHSKLIISGHKNPKDRAIIIDREGKLLLNRLKYDESTLVETQGIIIGLMLCDEIIVQGMSNMQPTKIDFIFHPIGVGMFSEDQFDEWIYEARKFAIKYIKYNTMIMGASHADGSFKNSDISIPFSYCIDEKGNDIFISKNDVRPRILNTESRQVRIIDVQL